MKIPRWAAVALIPIVFLVVVPLVHSALPWFLSTRYRRFGWFEGGPGTWNLLGLLFVIPGALLLFWLLATSLKHAAELPDYVPLNWQPRILLTRGPYALSRHPMYLAELSLWLGWTVFFGSLPVAIGFAITLSLVNLLARHEERTLEAQFGDEYRRYREHVPRWVGTLRQIRDT